MRYLALACDYDGTLARGGRVDEATLAALQQFRESGRLLVLVTGRRLDDLAEVFPKFELFDRIVAENGAILHRPKTRETKCLAESPPPDFVRALERRRVRPLAAGQVIVATEEPHETTVLEVIRDQGLELHVIFNKGAVMVLPSGTNKATGLAKALGELGISPHNTVGIGDAENDHAFLALCECSVAVADALPSLRERADLVTRGGAGDGARELCERILATDLAELSRRLERHVIPIGKRPNGSSVGLSPYGSNVLLAGPSGSGKSTLAMAILEELAAREYQYCVIDPEGDHAIEGAVVLGDEKHPPTVTEALELLAPPAQNAVFNLLGISLEDRPAFFASLFPRLVEQRSRTARPHWIVVDEAHHMMPLGWEKGLVGSDGLTGMFLITVHPETVSRKALDATNIFLIVGKDARREVEDVASLLAYAPPELDDGAEAGAVAWDRRAAGRAIAFQPAKPHGERRRHLKKYSEGELGPERSFYFRGPKGKLSLRAQNLVMFLQLAEGIDDETWQHHLRRGDYSRWIGSSIKDDELAREIAAIEAARDVSPALSRTRVRAAIRQRYTAPA